MQVLPIPCTHKLMNNNVIHHHLTTSTITMGDVPIKNETDSIVELAIPLVKSMVTIYISVTHDKLKQSVDDNINSYALINQGSTYTDWPQSLFSLLNYHSSSFDQHLQ